jgi:prophage regulatory protein
VSILRKPEVKAETGWRSDASVSKAVRDGLLTKPVQLGPRAVGWPDNEVKAINSARIAGKTDADIRALVTRLHAQRKELATA